ncbi:MAG: hypothetical protein OEV40_21645 [Acidimicrobiia bacterium]|nr:hypothetical protein [Acidimicrobiia bacterium]
MTSTTRHQAHDQLVAQVRLTKKRLEQFTDRLQALDEDAPAELVEQAGSLGGRAEELESEILSWEEVEIGVPTAVEDLAASVDSMEADLDAAESAEAAAYEVALDRQVRAWKTRLDRFRLQGALGRMEAKDDLGELSQRLDHVRGEVLVQLHNAVDDSKDLVTDLRDDVEEVLADVRRAIERVASSLSSDQ